VRPYSPGLGPLYYQVREKIREDIEKNGQRPGTMVPSEAELCSKFQVSRITVRRALSDLVTEGLLTRERGRGTFITEPRIERNFASDVSFARDMLNSGYSPASRDVSVSTESCSPYMAGILSVRPGDSIVRISRTHIVAGEPVMRQETLLPQVLCAGVSTHEFAENPLFLVLEDRCGLHFERVRTSIVPTLLSNEDAALLDASPGSPALFAEQELFTDRGSCVVSRSTVRGDRCRFVAETSFPR
jgi:GntR family transcriptional regulator